jgi:adenine-specific DNA-methyltransferase
MSTTENTKSQAIAASAATTEPERLDLRSHDIEADKQAELLWLFPEARTEGGKIDFDRLRLALGQTLDVGKERFGMNWPGKADCFRTIQTPSVGTLRPCPEQSVNFDTTENLIIEGDNLEVLKLLQKSYLGKVKMIYIDPPFNTGNDFIYPDNYAESLETYLKFTGQVDAEGRKFGTNTDADGRFHSKWMNMMYPRMYLARNLLCEDGAIFVSVDDTELHQLRNIMNEVFGEDNFVECFVWKRSYGGGAKEKFAVSQHEYILMYCRAIDSLGDLWLPPNEQVEKKYYKYRDDKVSTRGPYRLQPLEAGKTVEHRENLIYSVTLPDGKVVSPKRQWLWSKDRLEKALLANEIVITEKNGETTLSYKQYLLDEPETSAALSHHRLLTEFIRSMVLRSWRRCFQTSSIFSFPNLAAS